MPKATIHYERPVPVPPPLVVKGVTLDLTPDEALALSDILGALGVNQLNHIAGVTTNRWPSSPPRRRIAALAENYNSGQTPVSTIWRALDETRKVIG